MARQAAERRKPRASAGETGTERPALLRDLDIPTVDQWWNLKKVAGAIDAIIDDAPARNGNALLGGLLGATWEPQSDGRPLSKLGAIMASRGGSYSSVLTDWADELCRAMPGVHDLGDDPVQRMAALRVKLRDMPAYSWFYRQLPYKNVLKALKGTRVHAPYREPYAEFRLIAAIIPKLSTALLFSGPIEPRYPSKKEIEDGLKAAQLLHRLYTRNTGIVPGQKFNLEAHSGIRSVITELTDCLADFKQQPRNARVALQRETLEAFIIALGEAFGHPSVTVVEHLARLIGYAPDKANIYQQMRKLGFTTTPASEKAGSAPPARADSATGLGMWAGLGQRASS